MFFNFNRTNYSRYGYCAKLIEHLLKMHPGAKKEIMKIRITARRNYKDIGQAVDLAGE